MYFVQKFARALPTLDIVAATSRSAVARTALKSLPVRLETKRAFSRVGVVKMPLKSGAKYTGPELSEDNQTEEERQTKEKEKEPEESKEGKQHVAFTSNTKKSTRKNVSDDNNNGANSKVSNKTDSAIDCATHWEDHHARSGAKEYQKFKEQDGQDEVGSEGAQSESGSAHGDDQEQPAPKKRGRGANQKGTNKKQKAGGSSSEPKGTAGDKTRVPQVGQKVQWHALPGYVDGEVVEVVYEQKTVEGKTVKGSNEDPRIVLRSKSSGKIAVHKPEAVYFD